jgi:hypothetical protein
MCGGSGKRDEPDYGLDKIGGSDMEIPKAKTKPSFVRTPLKVR